MTDKELERLLSSKEILPADAPERKNVSLVLSPHIVRNAAILKKRRHDRIQALLCILCALLFMGAFAFVFFCAQDPAQSVRIILAAAAAGMALTLLCAPVLAWHEEKS